MAVNAPPQSEGEHVLTIIITYITNLTMVTQDCQERWGTKEERYVLTIVSEVNNHKFCNSL